MKKILRFGGWAFLFLALAASAARSKALADRAGPYVPPTPPTPPPAGDEAADLRADIPKGQARLFLRDGSRITGSLAEKGFTVRTAFGDLSVPASEFRGLKVGTAADPTLGPRIAALVERLGDASFENREAATADLKKIGPAALRALEAATRGKDEEVRTRAEGLIEEIGQTLNGAPPPREEDEIETTAFTVVGTLGQDGFKVTTPHGDLTVGKGQVARLLLGGDGPDRARIKIPGQALAGYDYFLQTPVVLKKGDRVRVAASGKFMSPEWGMEFGPDGLPANYGMFRNQPGIPMGSLVGRVGKAGKLFPAGAGGAFTADGNGPLYLAIALQEGISAPAGEFTAEISRLPGEAAGNGSGQEPGPPAAGAGRAADPKKR